jgi:hypothetical protein
VIFSAARRQGKGQTIMTTATITPTGIEVDWQAFILEEISNPQMKRLQVAHTYRILMEKMGARADWKAVNATIMKRWSKSGLVWIKTRAHSDKPFV